jgi:amidohydrolase
VSSADQAGTLAQLIAGIELELPRAVALRHRLHAHPELAHEEHQTAATIAAHLPVQAATVAGTGLIARIGPAEGAAVAVRAELDGLPVTESTGAPFSAAAGVVAAPAAATGAAAAASATDAAAAAAAAATATDAGGGRMHACGHDVHMAALVALARAAHALGEALPAPLLAMLQPSEEAYPSGAEQMATELAAPDRDALAPAAIVAVHIHPELPWGSVALDPGTINASCDYVTIAVRGEPAHGAYPHRGRDPILALAQIVVALHAQVARRIDPLHPATLTVGVLHGGSAENVMPAHAQARAALRAYRPEDRRALRALVEEVVTGVAAAHGCSGAVELFRGEPALENDPAIVARALSLLAGAGLRPASEWRSCGSDDLAFFSALDVPLAMGFAGLDGAEGFQTRPLHHPELLVPDAAIGAVARAQAALYIAAAESLPGG